MSRNNLTSALLGYARELAREAEARAVLVYADVFADLAALEHFADEIEQCDVIFVSRQGLELSRPDARVIRVPDVRLTRFGQIKVALLLGLSQGMLKRGDRLICLTGIAESGVLDTMTLMEVGEEFEMFAPVSEAVVTSRVQPDTFSQVIDIAVSLGREGREGNRVGTTLVLGDADNVLKYSQPLVLNPFKGYEDAERSVFDPGVVETIKEFAAIDGAFLIREDGIVEAAGVFLRSPLAGDELPRGLGTRHASAAAITAATRAIAVTVSQSTGNVTVYGEGKVLVEIENPRPIGPASAAKEAFFRDEAESPKDTR